MKLEVLVNKCKMIPELPCWYKLNDCKLLIGIVRASPLATVNLSGDLIWGHSFVVRQFVNAKNRVSMLWGLSLHFYLQIKKMEKATNSIVTFVQSIWVN